MKTQHPSASQFCKRENYEVPTANFIKYTAVNEVQKSVLDVMQEYGKECASIGAKYGAKSIRHQAIELIQDILEDSEVVENLIRKIQNLEP